MRSQSKKGTSPLGTAASKSNKTPGKAQILGLQPATLEPQRARVRGWGLGPHTQEAGNSLVSEQNAIPHLSPPHLPIKEASPPSPFIFGAKTQSDCQGSQPRALDTCVHFHRQQGRSS